MKKRLLLLMFIACISCFALCESVDAAITIKVGETKTIDECSRSTTDSGNGSKIKDTKIATLDMSSGKYLVTGKKVGSTTFTCDEEGFLGFGNHDVDINVVDADTGSMTQGSMIMKVGEVKQLTCSQDGKAWYDDSGVKDKNVADVEKIVGDQWYIKGLKQGTTSFLCDTWSNEYVEITVTRDDGTSSADSYTVRVDQKLKVACQRDTEDKQGWGTGNGTKIKDTYVAGLDIKDGFYYVIGKHEGNTVLVCDVPNTLKDHEYKITVVPKDAEEADSSESGDPPGWEAPEEVDLPDVDVNEFYNETEVIGENFCSEPGVKKVLRFAGYFLYILRIAVPLIIIVSGSLLFFKAVVSDNDNDLKKSAIVFGKKVAAAILVFFVPTLFEAMFSLYTEFSEVESQYAECAHCLNNPGDCEVPVGSTTGGSTDSSSTTKTSSGTAANCSIISYTECAKYTNCEIAPPSGNSTPGCRAKTTTTASTKKTAANCSVIGYSECAQYTNCEIAPPSGSSTPGCRAKTTTTASTKKTAANCNVISYSECAQYSNCVIIPPNGTGSSMPTCGNK